MRHRSLHFPLRHSIAEFLRTFTTGVLSQKRCFEAAEKLTPRIDSTRLCNHKNRVTENGGQMLSVSCLKNLAAIRSEFENELPTTTMLIVDLVESGLAEIDIPIRVILEYVGSMLCSAVSVHRAFKTRFESKQTEAARLYSNLFESTSEDERLGYGIESDTNSDKRDENGLIADSKSNTARTGELYPGRPLVRTRVRFTNGNGQEVKSEECSKSYRHGHNHSPGLFTLQCACAHPKLLGISVTIRSESISTALTAVQSRFKELKQVAFYDNACSLACSVMLRFPWVTEKTKILCDRFHYRTHKCGPEFDPDSYTECNDLLTSEAEALNRQWPTFRNNIL